MGKYVDYFKYVFEHKKNVFKVCWSKGLYIHAFTHDLSKFSPSEYFPYADWFNGPYGVKYKITDNNLLDDRNILHEKAEEKFQMAWEHHYTRNKHHWKFWEGKDVAIPDKYIEQMICDWEAMSIKFGGSAQEYYMKNYYKINMERYSRWRLETLLGLTPNVDQCDEEYWMTIGDMYNSIVELYEESPCDYIEPEEYINCSLFPDVNEKYDINIFDMIKDATEVNKKEEI